MKSFTVNRNDSGQRLDRVLLKMFPSLPRSLMYKEIRKKNIKINKKRCDAAYTLCEGDIVELYLKDDVLQEKKTYYDFMRAPKELDIVYEDKNLILINKKAGILCHPDGSEYVNTLISSVKRRLYENGEWNPKDESFTPALANRLDRNTSGIIIAAKNAAALKELNAAIKSRNIEKHYLAAVHGEFKIKSATLEAFITKDEKKNTVSVYDRDTGNAKKIITKYTVLDSYSEKSLIDIDLVTGRTHQIRAHMAHIGHPLIDDGKYGREAGRFRQALCSYKLIFKSGFNLLSYLEGREFTLDDCEIYKKFKERKY